jgi:two-component system, response regulator
VLLDLNLPKVGGLEVLERLRADPRTRRVLVVILTSSDLECDLARSYDLGANSYVRKPVDYGEFLAAISQLGFYWLERNEIPPRVDAQPQLFDHGEGLRRGGRSGHVAERYRPPVAI